MNALGEFMAAIYQLAKFVCSIPALAVNVRKQHRQANERSKQFEIERLDRLRNPSRYLGK